MIDGGRDLIPATVLMPRQKINDLKLDSDSELEVKDTISTPPHKNARLFFALIAEKCHKNVEN